MKILYTGPLWKGSTCESRRQVLVDLGYEVVGVDYEYFFRAEPMLLRKAERYLRIGPANWRYNKELMRVALDVKPDVVWVDKGIFVTPETLKRIKSRTSALCIHHITDDIMNKKHRLHNYLKSLKIYDIHFTSNKYNHQELKDLGADNVYLIELGYDSSLHKPMELSEEDWARFKIDVGFIGHWEPTTEDMILYLIDSDVKIRVWGEGWDKAREKKKLQGYVQFKPVWREDYVKTILATKINLCFLSKWNRNTTAGRSFEIPACGGFLLAERTEEHLAYYEEGKESEFFSTHEELLSKIKFYLSHDELRRDIAKNGRERCLRSGYSWKDRMEEMMSIVKSFR